MSFLNRATVLNTMLKHETLLFQDISKEENMGIVANKEYLQFLLDELTESGYLVILSGVTPTTYSITGKGIIEATRLQDEVYMQFYFDEY
ncbi:hypothetical protein OCK74_21985 [Chitinophagaceae bacterium LB-8]|uniref:Uncharacterized protein n=1 Tax=Paraflavisolibacter caeni TaxID=2982496 RepID=A0A9X2XZI3_9BACT|nr:hypothetical protein [Paraflavisolibacter caeni]MCU7551806.1 hypothetical protein [Paraflavisolibacter caeni]